MSTIAFPGDSLTQGFVSPGGYLGGFRKALWEAWVASGLDRLITPIGEQRDPAFPYSDHSGVGGETTAEITARVVANFGTLSTNVRLPDLWVVLAGTNDALLNNGSANPTLFINSHYRALLDACHAASPVPIIVSTIPDTSDVNVRVRVNTINAGLPAEWDAAELAGLTLHRRDWRTLTGDHGVPNFGDQFHWSTTGYGLVAADIDPVIRSILGLA